MSNRMPDYIKTYGMGCSCFIETGTHAGGTLSVALDLNMFDELYSCDIDQSMFEVSFDKFCDFDNVHLYHKSSIEFLKEVLPKVNKRTLFWLDAHDVGKAAPLEEELNLIKNLLEENNHVIMIDDIPVYFGDGLLVKEQLLDINSNYIIDGLQCSGDWDNRPNYILVAY